MREMPKATAQRVAEGWELGRVVMMTRETEKEKRERNTGNREEGNSPRQLKGTFLILNAYFTNLLWRDET